MRFFKKTRRELLNLRDEAIRRLAEISRNTHLLNEKMDKINTGEGAMVQVVDEVVKLREELVEEVSQLKVAMNELKEEQEGTGIIMASFIKLETSMIEKMSKFFELEAKSTEMAISTKPAEPTEHDKVF